MYVCCLQPPVDLFIYSYSCLFVVCSHKSTSSWGKITDAFRRVTGIGAKQGGGETSSVDGDEVAAAVAAAPVLAPAPDADPATAPDDADADEVIC